MAEMLFAVSVFVYNRFKKSLMSDRTVTIIGLMPLYHALAVSLLSVGQMESGMLYAVWAIPAALIFMGAGSIVSRRAFAKHQVL